MKILVTGGLGGIGRVTVARLRRHDHDVLALDRVPEAEVQSDVWEAVAGAEHRQVEVRDFEALGPHFEGVDAVIHLAALPHPSMGSEVEVVDVNCRGAFNIYRAAADAGIKRVVSASSINALGYAMGVQGFPIRYFPVDEAHPTMTSDPYSFSKQMLEEIAAYFWRREGISGVCLRFPFVFHATSHWAERFREFFSHRQQAFDELVAMPPGERRARVDAVIAEFEAGRVERPQERPWGERRHHHREGAPPPPERALMFGRTDFWAIIAGEDAAQALERGVTASYDSSHPLFVCDRDNAVG
ncbi:MAG: NAD(P)-dependent oxidoreductase, partial [Anaerolineae bacterium]|nr:NAD(P)-dependent oxidoreductase [Anaerolineae bacterium]